MAREFIGMIMGTRTRTVYMVIDPDDDSELDHPGHLLLGNDKNEPVAMVKVKRKDYGLCTNGEEVSEIISRYYVINGLFGSQAEDEHLEP